MIFNRKSYQTTRQRSTQSEREAARLMGGKVQPASGAINRFDLKADVKSVSFLVDDKVTDNLSYSLKYELWAKLSSQAWANRRRPCLRLNFTQGEPLYVVDETTFLEMKKAWEATKGK